MHFAPRWSRLGSCALLSIAAALGCTEVLKRRCSATRSQRRSTPPLPSRAARNLSPVRATPRIIGSQFLPNSAGGLSCLAHPGEPCLTP